MASPFKIPKRNLSLDAVSGTIQMQSPLSRLQDASDPFEKNWGGTSSGRADGIHSAYGLGARVAKESVPRNTLFQDGVKSMLGLNKGNSGMSSTSERLGKANLANHKADHSEKSQLNNQSSYWTPPHLQGQKHPESSTVFSNGWRPKRASDRLLLPSETEEISSALERKGKDDSLASVRSSSVEPENSPLDESTDKEPEVHRFTSGGRSRWRLEESGRGTTQQDHSQTAEKKRSWDTSPNRTKKSSSAGINNSDQSSEEDFVCPPRASWTTAVTTGSSDTRKPPPSSSSFSLSRPLLVPRQVADKKVSLNRTSWLAASTNLHDHLKELREEEKQKRREAERERSVGTRPPTLHLRLRTAKRTPSEPIVLSSEEEEGGEDHGDGEGALAETVRMPESSKLQPAPPSLTQSGEQAASRVSGGGPEQTVPVPSVVELGFTAVHVGLAHAHASGTMKITDCRITIPFKGSQGAGGGTVAEDGVVTLVASQVRAYALWDGGLARGGALLRDWEGPVPSVLFFWVTDTQANLLKSELSAMEPAAEAGQACAVLLLSLREQLGALQAALLASMLDMEQYRLARSPDLPSPLDWAQGLAVLHSLPPPLDTHLLGLLGQTGARVEERPSPTRSGLHTRKPFIGSSALQELPTRLIQYPAAPCKGRITVTTEDLACLDVGEFLNDVIIDFYLKYLLLERAESSMAERCHVFSSFFYKQLSRRRAAGEDDAASIPDRDVRHQRVKTWTRNVNIFDKDFLFVPVNQESHWYLVVVCYPGLEEARYEEWQSPGAASGKPQSEADGTPEAKRPRDTQASSSASSQTTAGGAGLTRIKPDGSPLKSHRPPECTQEGWQKETVLRRPCILLMDSLKLSYHENVCRLLRDYLHVEWQVRRGTPRLFTADTMRNSNCRVPLQDNSSDCGLYLLQYVESFLQNPVVHFEPPLRLENWFPRQRVWKKRVEIRRLVLEMHKSQQNGKVT